MSSSRVISGILFITVLFSQTDKGKEHLRHTPKKFENSFILEPSINHSQFQNQFDSDEFVSTPGSKSEFYDAKFHSKAEDDIIIEHGISIPERQYNLNRSTDDTLAYHPPGGWSGQFIMSPGDAMMMTFAIPAGGIIKGINIPIYEWGSGDQELTVSLHKLQYPNDINDDEYDQTVVDGDGWIGGYDMDITGTMNISGNVYSPGGTQGICDTNDILGPDITDPLLASEPGFGPPTVPPQGVVWPDSDNVVIMTPQTHPDYFTSGNLDNWIDLQDFGEEYEFQCGERIGVLFQFTGDGGGDDEPVGFFYTFGDGWVDRWPFLKFYADCGGTSGNGGWHIRHWVINTEVAVEITSDRPPGYEFCNLPGIHPPGAAEPVCILLRDDNPSGGPAGVDSVYFMYALDSMTGVWNSIEMYLVSGDSLDGQWECIAPEPSPGVVVYWYIRYKDIGNFNCYTHGATPIFSYYIIVPTDGRDLIFNNQDLVYGNLIYSSWMYFYWGGNGFDIWDASYGPLSAELLDYYSTVIELSGNGGPIYLNDEEIENWWNSDKTYIVVGDEWLGERYGWEDSTTIPEGDIARTILGIDTYYPDINFSTSGDLYGISRFITDSTGVTSILHEFLSDSLLLNYDPQYNTGNYNWLDGIEIVDGYTVDMSAYSGILDSNGNVADDAEIYNVMVHGQAGNGGRSAFLAFDPIALNTTISYHWIGASDYWHTFNAPNCPPNASPLVSVYEALQGILSVADETELPKEILLKDNYPNPFNPITNIQYELHKNIEVKITIYDVLGREVKKLVSSEQVSGKHKITWNGTNDLSQPVSAGVYFYRVESGEFVQTRKMVLLK